MDKTLAFNVEVVGASREAIELERLTLEVKKLATEKAKLSKLYRDGKVSEEQATKQLAMLNTQLVAAKKNQVAYRDEVNKAMGVTSKFKDRIVEAGKELLTMAGLSAVAVSVLNKLKEAYLTTAKGIDLMNVAMQAQKQLFYDLIKTGQINTDNVVKAVQAQKELNAIRAGDREDLVQFAKLEREIAILEFEAADKTKTRAERQEALNKAIKKQNELSDAKLVDLGEELDANLRLLKGRADDEVLLLKIAQIKANIYNLDRERFEQSKRNESRMTGFMQEEKKEQEAAIERWYKEIEIWNEKNALLEKGTKEYAAMQDEIAKVIIAEAELAGAKMGIIDDGKYKAPDGSLKNSEIEAMAATNDEKERLWQEGLLAAQENFRKNKEQQQQAAEDTRQIDLAALDSKQAIVDAEIMITEGLSAAISEISGKNKAMTLAALAIEKSAAIAQIIANISIANAKSIATFPLTSGQPWVTLNTGLGAISIANLVAQTVKSVSEISGYATGGRIQGGSGVYVNTGQKDNKLILVNDTETVVTKDQVARLGGSGAMRMAKVPGYEMGGYQGQRTPEIPSAGFDYAQLARLMNSIEVKLDIHKVNAAQREISVITEPQRI